MPDTAGIYAYSCERKEEKKNTKKDGRNPAGCARPFLLSDQDTLNRISPYVGKGQYFLAVLSSISSA